MEVGGAQGPDLGGSPPSSLVARLQILTTLAPKHLHALLADDPVRAAPWVHASAEAGLPEGQVRYGRILLEGAGAPKNAVAACRWFLRAAERGDPEGQNMLGRCYENGWGVAVNAQEAARWFALAADQDHAWARYNLGHLYLDGLGVKRDLGRAFALYRLAAEAGHVRAMNLLARCFEEGWGVAPDANLARHWSRLSAEGGYFRGQYNFATLLLDDGDVEGAIHWFEDALEGAPPQSRSEMVRRLARRPEPDVRALAQRYTIQPRTVPSRSLTE